MIVAARVWRMLAGSLGFLTRYLLWRARFTARGQVRSGMSNSAISVRWSGSLAAQSSGGNVRRPGGGAADQSQGLGERDAVGIQVCGRGRFRDERADRVVHDQVGRQDRPHGEVVPWGNSFSGAALLRTTRARFRARGSPVTYAAVMTG